MPDSGPKDRTSLSDTDVFKIIREAAQIYDKGWVLALSGGEPFLYPERLLSFVRLASEHGAQTSIVSNGFWATSEKVARDLLKPFVEAGLGQLTLSVSSYHSAFIDPDRVSNAVLAGRDLGLGIGFKAVVSKSSTLRRIFGAVRRTEPWSGEFRIDRLNLLPQGRAAVKVNGDVEAELKIPRDACPSPVLTIKPSGDASPCCSGAGEVNRIKLGNIRDYSFAQLKDNFERNELLEVLRRQGPAALLDRLDPGVADDLRRKKYVNTCHLCIEVLKALPESGNTGKVNSDVKTLVEVC